MATYYRWDKNYIAYSETSNGNLYADVWGGFNVQGVVYYALGKVSANHGVYTLSDSITLDIGESHTFSGYYSLYYDDHTSKIAYGANPTVYRESKNVIRITTQDGNTFTYYAQTASAGSFVSYEYSTNSAAYPNNGTYGGFWYNNRTTVTSPTAPSGITTPAPGASITTPSVTVSWGTASSNTSYPVNLYELSYAMGYENSWTVVGTTAGTSMEVNIPAGTTSIRFRVRARDSNNQWGSYYTNEVTNPVYLAPTLTVPQQLMQGQQASINWTAIEGANSYTLQRKANTDTDWTQVYSGANTTFSETAGTWTTVQYRVQAVFDGTPGGWATSAEIPVVSASALVISGQDGDLGTLVNDVPYSISTDTGNQITATITTNGAVIFSGNVGNSTAGVIPVLDLINGSGTIVIEASVTASSGPVSAVRTWTYTKTMMTFPNAGSIAELTKDGKVMWPETLAEAVRIPGGKTLDQVMGFPCQIYTGSYVGTGTFGADNPNELTFSFEPKIIIDITPGDNSSTLARSMIRPNRRSYVGSNPLYVTWDGNSVSWCSLNSSTSQLNGSGKTYYYVALG